MAITQNPVVGRAKNKMANVIFSEWKGRNVVRSLPISVANPRTELQIVNRKRISFLAKTAKEISQVINLTLKNPNNTAYNRFAQLNYSKFAAQNIDDISSWAIAPVDLTVTNKNLQTDMLNIVISPTGVWLGNATTQVRAALRGFVIYFRNEVNVIQEDMVLSIEEITKHSDIEEWLVSIPGGASSMKIVVYDRLNHLSNEETFQL